MNETIGARVKKLREKRGLTQRGLALKANIANSTISRIEKNQNIPYGNSLESLAKALNVSTDFILTGEVDVNTTPAPEQDDFQFALYDKTKDLSDRQKQDILNIIDALKKGNI